MDLNKYDIANAVGEVVGEIVKEQMEDKLPTVPFVAYDALHLQYQEEMKTVHLQYQEEMKTVREEIYREKNKELKGWKTACISMILVWLIILCGVGYIFLNFEFATYTQDVETGNASFVGNEGDISYGETKDSSLAQETK